ncbi:MULTISPECIES: hypothetical protein [unclassified Mesorhizobium]|uniref:hypothetical protein n=1 Tax=unclassified Mesorhizobium TaxID=325217 RepID=UPI00112C2A8A|nr:MULTISPECIES: hypothetical protein [unclassified Mesorhizobium]TPN61165.1 hypothetical protein FJ986_29555 [Mesorhizobium sp. B1-1-1]
MQVLNSMTTSPRGEQQALAPHLGRGDRLCRIIGAGLAQTTIYLLQLIVAGYALSKRPPVARSVLPLLGRQFSIRQIAIGVAGAQTTAGPIKSHAIVAKLHKHHHDDRSDNYQDKPTDKHRQQSVVRVDIRINVLCDLLIILLWFSHGPSHIRAKTARVEAAQHYTVLRVALVRTGGI